MPRMSNGKEIQSTRLQALWQSMAKTDGSGSVNEDALLRIIKGFASFEDTKEDLISEDTDRSYQQAAIRLTRANTLEEVDALFTEIDEATSEIVEAAFESFLAETEAQEGAQCRGGGCRAGVAADETGRVTDQSCKRLDLCKDGETEAVRFITDELVVKIESKFLEGFEPEFLEGFEPEPEPEAY